MKRATHRVGLVGLACILVLPVASCGKDEPKKPDSTSKATPHKAEKVTLPPKGEGYEVLGQLAGVQKYVVRYDRKLYRGGHPHGQEGFDSLKKLGIKTIVTVTPTDEERKLAKANGMALVEVPFDKKTGVSKESREAFMAAMKAWTPVYVHCHGGTHRASTLCVLYRTKVQGWAWEKAAKEFEVLGGDQEKDKIILDAVR